MCGVALDEIVRLLHKNDALFEAHEKAYQDAAATLHTALSPLLDDKINAYLNAFESDVLSSIIYAGYLGFRLNLGNFHSPIGVDFIRRETVDTIKAHLFGHFPINYKNRQIKMAFEMSLPDNLLTCHETIMMYFNILECAAPKLACYWGYLSANRILPWAEPGYQIDCSQTTALRAEMQEFFGFPIPDIIATLFCDSPA